MEAHKELIQDALISFFKDDSEEVVEFMESMLYDWYQHYAVDHYHIEHINKVVNTAFKVNDLLLRLNNAMQAARDNPDINADLPHRGLNGYRIRARADLAFYRHTFSR